MRPAMSERNLSPVMSERKRNLSLAAFERNLFLEPAEDACQQGYQQCSTPHFWQHKTQYVGKPLHTRHTLLPRPADGLRICRQTLQLLVRLSLQAQPLGFQLFQSAQTAQISHSPPPLLLPCCPPLLLHCCIPLSLLCCTPPPLLRCLQTEWHSGFLPAD